MKETIIQILILSISLAVLTGCSNISEVPFEIQESQTLGDIGSKAGDTFTFSQSDLKTETGQKTIGLYLPIKFNKEVVGITQNLDCTVIKNGEKYLATFDTIEDTDRGITSINGEFNLRANMLFGSNDQNVVLNTGSSTGTRQEGVKIMKAPKKSNAGVYYYFTNDIGSDLNMTCKSNIISENPIFSASKQFTIVYNKISSTEDNTNKEAIELGNIQIGHGKVLPSGEIQFMSEDIVIGDRIYSANIGLEVLVNKRIRDVYFDLKCVDSSTKVEVIPSLKEENNVFIFLEHGLDIDGRVTLSGSSDVIFNSGSSQGTKIIEADRGDNLLILLQFNFGELDSSKSMDCKALLISSEPDKVFDIPLEIKYVK